MIDVTKADCQVSEMNDVENSRNDDCHMPRSGREVEGAVVRKYKTLDQIYFRL